MTPRIKTGAIRRPHRAEIKERRRKILSARSFPISPKIFVGLFIRGKPLVHFTYSRHAGLSYSLSLHCTERNGRLSSTL